MTQSPDSKDRQPQAAGNPCPFERSENRDTRAEQGSSLDRVESLRNFQSVTGRRLHEFGVAAINSQARNLLPHTQILVSFSTEFAITATPVQPRDSNTITHLQVAHAGARLNYASADLVSQD